VTDADKIKAVDAALQNSALGGDPPYDDDAVVLARIRAIVAPSDALAAQTVIDGLRSERRRALALLRRLSGRTWRCLDCDVDISRDAAVHSDGCELAALIGGK